MNLQEFLFLALDLTGTFVFAVSGVLLAARRNFDITGGLVLGTMTGIGGGMIRDVLPVSYTHLTLPTKEDECRSRWSPYH